jgi:hypothetical protein
MQRTDRETIKDCQNINDRIFKDANSSSRGIERQAELSTMWQEPSLSPHRVSTCMFFVNEGCNTKKQEGSGGEESDTIVSAMKKSMIVDFARRAAPTTFPGDERWNLWGKG